MYIKSKQVERIKLTDCKMLQKTQGKLWSKPGLTIDFFKKKIFKPNLKTRDRICIPSTDWVFTGEYPDS